VAGFGTVTPLPPSSDGVVVGGSLGVVGVPVSSDGVVVGPAGVVVGPLGVTVPLPALAPPPPVERAPLLATARGVVVGVERGLLGALCRGLCLRGACSRRTRRLRCTAGFAGVVVVVAAAAAGVFGGSSPERATTTAASARSAPRAKARRLRRIRAETATIVTAPR
jgi:hypothetical protein